MNPVDKSRFTARLIAAALGLVSVLVFTGSVTDPVNVTKLCAIGGFAFASLGSILNKNSFKVLNKAKAPLFAAICFLIVSLVVLLQSKAPFAQSLYGVYGRNNGFILYLCLILIFIAALTLISKSDFSYVVYALIFAGLVNVAYGLWVMAFGDFISWNNQYGNLLGTFGNPNFVGSFFGMFSSLLYATIFSRTIDKRWKVSAMLLLPIVFITIMDTKAVQGKILFVAAGGITLFFYVRDRFKSKYWSATYLIIASSCFITALFGTLQKGPLAGLLYKPSISLRGEYWHSGWQTGISNPWFGAGFDSLGDWYRRSRRESALTLPGVDTVINTAHNVYMDMFAFGGWPLLISYCVITGCVLVSITRFIRHNLEFDFTFVTLVSLWACYQLQSIISINQVGLAIWGWVTAGLLIAYTNISESSEIANQLPANRIVRLSKSSNSSDIFSQKLLAGILTIIGLLVSVPPLSADMKWRDAQVSQDVNKVIAILQSSYMNPLSSFKINNIVGVLETNGFSDAALEYAIKAVEFNPNNYDSWKNLSIISKSSDGQKSLALNNMKRLDPLNPNISVISK